MESGSGFWYVQTDCIPGKREEKMGQEHLTLENRQLIEHMLNERHTIAH